MATNFTYTDLFKTYRESQKKYDYFFLGVIVASLSLSVQAIEMPSAYFLRIMLLISWTLFIASFISGMFRQERLLRFYRIEADKLKFSQKKELFVGDSKEMTLYKSVNEVWTSADMADEVAHLDAKIELADKYLGKDQRATSIAYAIQKWSFVASIIGIIIIKFFS